MHRVVTPDEDCVQETIPLPENVTHVACRLTAPLQELPTCSLSDQHGVLQSVSQFQAYANVLKANMDGLKKKEKTKGKSKVKTKAT